MRLLDSSLGTAGCRSCIGVVSCFRASAFQNQLLSDNHENFGQYCRSQDVVCISLLLPLPMTTPSTCDCSRPLS